MPKRFTEANKWRDAWFRRLNPSNKLFWMFITDSCDVAGMWELDLELAAFFIGYEYNLDSILSDFEGRIVQTKYGLYICGFIEFQYGELSEKCNPHKPVITLMRKYQSEIEAKNKGYFKGCLTLKEKEKDQDQDQDKEKEKEVDPSDFFQDPKDPPKTQDDFLTRLVKDYARKNGPAPDKSRAFFAGELKNGRTLDDLQNAIYKMQHNTPYWELFPREKVKAEIKPARNIWAGKHGNPPN